MADKITGLSALSAILAALFEREKSGLGQAIEVPMFETMVAFNLLEHMGGATFDKPGENMAYARAVSPHRKPYRTADGFIGLLPYTTTQWQRFFDLAGRPEVMHDPKFATPEERAKHVGELYEMLESIVIKRSSAEWLAIFEANDIPAAYANKLEDLQQDPHLVATNFFQSHDHPTEGQIVMAKPAITFSRTPASVRSLAPNLGEHNKTILNKTISNSDLQQTQK
jgi:crotonobetainyl-CoA:carnitine CoA-transferase CaiB-like acyl-CoA transferase